jgi:predicted ATPase/DNA-binding XRE family transcriptional regulator
MTSEFGELLRRHRRAAGFSQEYLAERALLSTTAIGLLERGLRHAPRRETIALLVQALDLSQAESAELENAANSGRARLGRDIHDELPEPITSFVGRADEIVTLCGLVLGNEQRLITITGPGGVGKSRFALETARRVVYGFEDGAYVVPLAGITDLQLVALAIVNAVGARERADRSLIELLQRTLKNRSALIVLDNCEHLLESVAQVAASIVTACPRIRLLATSRERLRVAGELTFNLSALPYPLVVPRTSAEAKAYSAVQLFLDRASHLCADRLEIDESGIAAVAEIVRKLDGLPLAIELAVPMLQVLSMGDLAKQLKHRFRLLATGERDALPHHQSLRGMIDWSNERLSEEERALFRRCSVFAGSFSLAAISAVCSDSIHEPDVLGLFSALVDKSLIRVVDRAQGRYELLDVIREYAQHLVRDTAEQNELSRRHAEHYLAVAREARAMSEGPESLEYFRRLKLDARNLESALSWALVERGAPDIGAELAIALDWFFFHDSYMRSRHWFEAALGTLDRATSPELFARLTIKICLFTQLSPDITNQIANLEHAVSFYRGASNAKSLMDALGWLGFALGSAGDFQRAQMASSEAVVVSRNASARDRAWVAHLYARILMLSDLEKAREVLEESVAICALAPDQILSDALSTLSEVLFLGGDVDLAIEHVRKALGNLTAHPAMITTQSAGFLANLAGYLLSRGDVDGGIAKAQEALELSLGMGDAFLIACIIQHLATASVLRGNPRRAALLLGFVLARTGSVNKLAMQVDLHFRVKLSEMIASALSEIERCALLREGAEWSEDRAVEEARAVS